MTWFPHIRKEQQKSISLNTPPKADRTNAGYDDELLEIPPPVDTLKSSNSLTQHTFRSESFSFVDDGASNGSDNKSFAKPNFNNLSEDERKNGNSVELRNGSAKGTADIIIDQDVLVQNDLRSGSRHDSIGWMRSLSRNANRRKASTAVVGHDGKSQSGCDNKNDDIEDNDDSISDSSRTNRRNKRCAWCSRNALVIWAVVATILLIVNMAITSGLLKRNVEYSNKASVANCQSGGNNNNANNNDNNDATSDNQGANQENGNTVDDSDSRNQPTTASTSANQTSTSANRCGCPTCSEAKWNKPVGTPASTCGQRIEYLLASYPARFPSEVDACRQIAFEFPCDCGMCDPGRCSIFPAEFFVPDNWTPKDDYSVPATPAPRNVDSQTPHNLYCYPPVGQRVSYASVWDNGYYVEVKDGRENPICGPGNNRFDPANVVFDATTKALKLLYKNAAASEVRVLLPNDEKFTYGDYKFEIGSITVTNSSGKVTSNVLPKELVFGLFTWDDTEDYAIHENYNHEVDIEISRWNCETNSDVQFLVQPPGYPQMQRFFSGGENNKYSQQNHVYEFKWGPGRIDWSSTSGKGQEFTLKTEEALYKDVADYVQCMPDRGMQTEVRINLWNMLGAVQPASLAADDVVEIEITNFSFTPSTEPLYVKDGGFCTKHCQCNYPTSKCEGGFCTVSASS